MRLDEECRLSFYQQIASLNEDHGVYLVQNISDKKIYVKKILKIYNVEVFRYLKDNPIKNTPRIYEVIEDSNQLIVLEEYIILIQKISPYYRHWAPFLDCLILQ
ncbi:MAG: hypothetical protein SOZ47_00445 [Lawsonibacter sp.]|nr:hypothetical protein [Lawsonibacter sp.]